ncbi:MAG: DNA ligase, partial [Candidatus Liberibacter asiaticus]|nr:DNA ligase [Candidatus Liberibacter asiaticus]
TFRKLELSDATWEKLLKVEAQFLLKPNKLGAFLRKLKPVEKLSEVEAFIEVEYLVKIALHHQKWYYRVSQPLITDLLYDLLERRINQLQEKFPQHFAPDNPWNLPGC